MKGSRFWKFGYVLCALAGLLVGYGVFTLASDDEVKPNTITKDNTLVRESGDGVFFDRERQGTEADITMAPVVTETPATPQRPEPTPEESIHPTSTPGISMAPQEISPEPTIVPEPDVGHAVITPAPDTMPSLGSQWANAGQAVVPTLPPVVAPPGNEELLQSPAMETITYPAEIFGQVPVLNRSDAYVSYFEFAYDLIAMLEPEIQQRGLNLNALLAKFVIKALFCGVDIEKLDINAPIPRRLAALCLWLAAQILGERGSDTSAKSAQKYVTDISACSNAEKKAVAYLYEQGILSGYQIAGQRFYPDAGLATKEGTTWLSGIKECWK